MRYVIDCPTLLRIAAGEITVAPDEDAAPSGPQRDGATEALDQLGRQRLAHDAAHAVGAEPLPAARSASGKPRVRL